jgi:hypothetical protein
MDRDHATLFREFGGLDYRDRTGILAFASKYGLLGEPVAHQARWTASPPHGLPDPQAIGESHLNWASEICQMREALDATGQTGQRRDAARLESLFNRHLKHVHSTMIFDTHPDPGEVQAAPRLMYAPSSLLAAMWLQLALAIVGQKRFPACKACGRLFEISTEQSGFRSHREFCTEVCKTNHYRARKRRALELAHEGTTLRAIAAATETDKNTVRGWLSNRKQGGTRRR